MHIIRSSKLCVFHHLSDVFSCDETQKKAGETLANGQYLLTNGDVSFKVGKMEKTSLANLTKAKHSFFADNF